MTDYHVINKYRIVVMFPDAPTLYTSAHDISVDGITITPHSYNGWVNVMVPVLKGALADQYKRAFETKTTFSSITVYADNGDLSPFVIRNVLIDRIEPMRFNGTEGALTFRLLGQYP